MAAEPGPFADDPIRRWLPLIDERAERYRDPAEDLSLLATYCGSIERNARNIVAGIAALADVPAGGVVVHCSAGKDRTGMHVALVLRLAGVGLDDIAADYALAGDRRPGTIVDMLEYVEDRYGTVARYLRGNGVSRGGIRALRDRLRVD